jgi:hypothetical protein
MKSLDYKQLELFQEEHADDIKIFKAAKRIKSKVQKLYSKINVAEQSNYRSNIFEKYYILSFNMQITHISDKEIPEPDLPKLFIRKYEPSINLKDSNGNIIYHFKYDERDLSEYSTFLKSRVIPGYFGSICASDFGVVCASDFGPNCAII